MIIDRYITREVLKPLLAISATLIFIFVGYSSGRYLSYAADGLLQVETLASFIFIKMVIALEVLLPVALYLSIVLGLGALESHLEITALRASGIGHRRIMRIVIGIACLFALMVAAFSLFGRPFAYEKSYWIKAQAEAELELDKLESGNFYESADGPRTIFVENVDKKSGELRNIFVRGEHHGVVHVISARSGRHVLDQQTGRRILNLNAVYVYVLGLSGEQDRAIGEFRRMKLWISDAAPITLGYKRKAAATTALARSDSPLDIAELQWRLSTPVSTILLAVLAVILTRHTPRRSRYTRTLIAVVIYILYYNLTAMAKTWVETSVVGKVPGLWWTQCVLALLIVVLLLAPRWRLRYAALGGEK